MGLMTLAGNDKEGTGYTLNTTLKTLSPLQNYHIHLNKSAYNLLHVTRCGKSVDVFCPSERELLNTSGIILIFSKLFHLKKLRLLFLLCEGEGGLLWSTS